jgi:predicted transposase/invertase (TIGR01784 family)
LGKLSPEELNMWGDEWDLNIALEVEREEGYEKGREEGKETEREEIARNALAKGASIDFVKEITGLDDEAIRKLQEDVNSGGN